MATARDRLSPKKPKNDGDSSLALQVRPVIRMGAPKIDIPKIEIPKIEIPASDMKPIAEAIQALGQGLAQIANAQTQILQTMQQHHQLLAELVKKDSPTVNVPAPTVKMAPRPRAYRVELEKEGGETVGMFIEADTPN